MATQIAGMSLQQQNIKALQTTFNMDFSLTLKEQQKTKQMSFKNI